MTINRIESFVFGVEDIAECTRFFRDAGLDVVTADKAADGTVVELATAECQTVVLRPFDDPTLPAALEGGSTVREVVWGVDDQASLDRLADDLAADRAVTIDDDGTVHTVDQVGFGIGFRISREEQVDVAPTRYNMLRHVSRWNEPVRRFEGPHPFRFVHFALNIPKAGHREAIDFYLDRLGFLATDVLVEDGTFMRCPGDHDHHNLFLCHRPDVAGFNHATLEVRDIDDLIQTGNHMIEHGWREARTLGRHLLGSNLYRFVHSPAGGRLEFACDMDRLDDDFETRVWATNPGQHLWTLNSHGQLVG